MAGGLCDGAPISILPLESHLFINPSINTSLAWGTGITVIGYHIACLSFSSAIVTCRPLEIPCRLARRYNRINGENAVVPATSLKSGAAAIKQV